MFDESFERTAYSASKGDWNNDGRYDIIVSDGPVTASHIWENQNPAANWIKINLEGTVSNTDAIGSIVRCYVDGVCLMRAIVCGDGFMSQDSQNTIIGIGNQLYVDSLTINWPSGWTDTFYDLDANALYHFTEGETFEEEIVISQSFCSGDTIKLHAGNGVSYNWNNGFTTEEIEVFSPGSFDVEVLSHLGLVQHILFNVDTFQLAEIPFTLQHPTCFEAMDGKIVLEDSDNLVDSISWENNSGQFHRNELGEGMYECDIIFQNGCQSRMEFVLLQPSPISFEWSADTICFDGTTEIQWNVYGGSGMLEVEWNGIDPTAMYAGEFPVMITDSHDCILLDTVHVFSFAEIVFSYVPDTLCNGELLALDYVISGVDDGYFINWQEVDPEFMAGGDHTIIISNSNGCTAIAEIHIDESSPMEITTIVNNAMNGENGSIELIVDGGMEPYSYLWNNYSTENPLINIGQGIAEVVVTDAAGCKVIVSNIEIIDTSVEQLDQEIFISPNPCSDYLNINMPDQHRIFIYDAFGKIIFESEKIGINQRIETASWNSGVYFLHSGNSRMRILRL